MNSPARTPASFPPPPRAARRVLSRLEGLSRGSLALTLPDGGTRHLGPGDGPAAALRVHDWAVFGRVLAIGDAGLARDWAAGRWDTDALTALLDLLAANRDVLRPVVRGSAAGRLIHAFRGWPRRDAGKAARRDGAGVVLRRPWPDIPWKRAGAWWPEGAGEPDLGDAEPDRVLAQLDLPHGARLLELGCGRGVLTEAAARRGLRPTGLALSTAQLAFVRDRLRDAGLSGKADLRLQEHRRLRGRWDGIASIGMFERLGERRWPAWFDRLHADLAPGGRVVATIVTLGERHAGRHRVAGDFAWRRVFPGIALPARPVFETLARRHGFAVIDRRDFGRDGARMLAPWREALAAGPEAGSPRGPDAPAVRLDAFRLACCEAAFAHGDADVTQYTLLRAG